MTSKRVRLASLVALLALLVGLLPAATFAAPVPGGTASVTAVPQFSNAGLVSVSTTATNPGAVPAFACIFARIAVTAPTPPNAYALVGTALIAPNGPTLNTTVLSVAALPTLAEGNKVEFVANLNTDCTTIPAATTAAQGSTTIDNTAPIGYAASGPLNAGALRCNTFEAFSVARDNPAIVGGNPVANWAGMKDLKITGTTTSSGTLSAQATAGPVFLTNAKEIPLATNTLSVLVAAQGIDHADNATPVGTPTNNVLNRAALTAAEKANCKSFSDVSASDFFAVYARYLASGPNPLISGLPDGTFHGNDTVTRAQMAAFSVRTLGFPPAALPVAPPSAACTFSDVSIADWFAGSVWQACALGLMTGIGGGQFAPNSGLTRGQAVTVIDRIPAAAALVPAGQLVAYFNASVIANELLANGTSVRTLRGAIPFTDVLAGQFYTTAVEALYNIAVADGTSATTFSPNDVLTRGQLSKFLYRAFGNWVNL